MSYRSLKQRIIKHEGYRRKVYKDTAGIDTIGYGFAIKDLELSEPVCSIILEQKINEIIDNCQVKFSWYNFMPDEIQEVVIEMCYQLGIVGFSKFKNMIGFLEKSDWEQAADAMLMSKWAMQTPERANYLSEIVRNCKEE